MHAIRRTSIIRNVIRCHFPCIAKCARISNRPYTTCWEQDMDGRLREAMAYDADANEKHDSRVELRRREWNWTWRFVQFQAKHIIDQDSAWILQRNMSFMTMFSGWIWDLLCHFVRLHQTMSLHHNFECNPFRREKIIRVIGIKILLDSIRLLHYNSIAVNLR